MPWTVKDVDKHKKGLSDKKKKQWVRIANAVLKKCLAEGGSEKECAAAAIRQANGVVNANAGEYSVCRNKQEGGYDVRIVVHQEKPYYIVPVVMMIEGVLHGNRGPLLHKVEEFGKIPEAWNGIPVVIDHPEKEGVAISANSPEIIDMLTVGRVYNTKVEGKKLVAEAWLDEDRLNDIAPQVLEDVLDGNILEVSVGMFTDEEEEEGEYKGKKYEAVAYNHRPDHLAILTECVGACSVKDGCGLGVNKKEERIEKMTGFIKGKDLFVILAKQKDSWFKISPIETNAGEGFHELSNMMYDKLRSMSVDDKIYYYIEELYVDSVIYSKEGDNDKIMYKQAYKVEGGKIEFIGEPIQVTRKVEYIVVNENQSETIKKENKMLKKECPKCQEKIEALLANKESGFTEAHREWLNTLTEEQLDLITPKVIEKTVEKVIEVNRLSPEDEAALAFGKRQLKERREKFIKGIQANAGKERWTDEKLAGMSDDLLEDLYNSLKKEEDLSTDYSPMGGGRVIVHASGVEPLYPAWLEIENTKK